MGDTSRGVLAWITLHCSVLSPGSQDDAIKKVKVRGEEELYLQEKRIPCHLLQLPALTNKQLFQEPPCIAQKKVINRYFRRAFSISCQPSLSWKTFSPFSINHHRC